MHIEGLCHFVSVRFYVNFCTVRKYSIGLILAVINWDNQVAALCQGRDKNERRVDLDKWQSRRAVCARHLMDCNGFVFVRTTCDLTKINTPVLPDLQSSHINLTNFPWAILRSYLFARDILFMKQWSILQISNCCGNHFASLRAWLSASWLLTRVIYPLYSQAVSFSSQKQMSKMN